METKTCKACHHENQENARFCTECGAQLDEEEEKVGSFLEHSFVTNPNNNMQVARGFNPSALIDSEPVEQTMTEDGIGMEVRTVDTRVEKKENGDWYCPDCGERNGTGHMTCKGCGRYQ